MSYVKFLSGLPETRRCGLFVEYEGIIWYGSEMDTHDNIRHHPSDDVILKVYLGDDGRFIWEYSLNIAKGIYVRHHDSAGTLNDACSAALDFRPNQYLFDCTDRITWYETKPCHLTAAIDGEEATVRRIDAYPVFDNEPSYHWSRKWAPAGGVLSAVSDYNHELSGNAKTLDLAVLAVVEAPQRLQMACAALCASLVTTIRKKERNHA